MAANANKPSQTDREKVRISSTVPKARRSKAGKFDFRFTRNKLMGPRRAIKIRPPRILGCGSVPYARRIRNPLASCTTLAPAWEDVSMPGHFKPRVSRNDVDCIPKPAKPAMSSKHKAQHNPNMVVDQTSGQSFRERTRRKINHKCS